MCNDRSPRNGRPAPQAEQPRLVPNVTLRILCHFANVLSVVLHKSFLPIAGDRAGGRGDADAAASSGYPFTSKYLLTLAFFGSSSMTAPWSTPSP